MTEVELFRDRAPVVAHHGAVVPAGRADFDSWVTVASDMIRLAEYICETEFVPRAYRGNSHATAAAMLAGRELGLPPMTALRHVQVVEGSPSLSAEYKRARVLSAGHDFDIIEMTTTRCRISARRKGSGKPAVEFTYTIEDAKRAGLVKSRGAWETRPRRMLFARAGTEACDFMFADITNGLPTTELLEEGTPEDEFAGYNESPGQSAPAAAIEPPKPRTAQRRQREPKAEPADRPTGAPSAAGKEAATPDPQPPASGQAAPSGQPGLRPTELIPVGTEHAGLPPLPGEDLEVEDPPIDKDAPGSVLDSDGMVTKIQAIYHTDLGFKSSDRSQIITATEQVIGRELTGPVEGKTHNNLSWNEARLLIDTLERCGNRDNLIALLAASKDASDA